MTVKWPVSPKDRRSSPWHDITKFLHSTQNSSKCKTNELFISKISYLILWGRGWLWVTRKQNCGKGEMLQSLARSVNQKVQEFGIYFPFLLDKLLIVPEPVLLHEMFTHSCNCPLELHFRIQKPAFPLNTILWQMWRWLVYNVSRLHLSKLFHMRARGTVTNTKQSNVPPPPPHTQCFGL